MAEKAKVTKKKKAKKNIREGRVYVNSTFNNTLITFTDLEGNVIASSSTGAVGFKGSRKSTPYAAQVAAAAACEQAKAHGLEKVDAFVKGIGSGRESALRAVSTNDIYVATIKDTTSVPHNGCRPRKPRRV
jgi:small subunit ribosomal protein S11